MNQNDKLLSKRGEAEVKAWNNLARYKFLMFGYWAGTWVTLNRLCEDSLPNPFRHLVICARKQKESAA